jgi:hypothetical protein
MAEPELIQMENRRPLPREIVLRADGMEVAFTPRELRMIRENTGRTWSQIITDEDGDDKYTVLAWLKLRREGYDVTLDQLDDVVIRVPTTAEQPEVDPTSGGRSTTSPASATSGE